MSTRDGRVRRRTQLISGEIPKPQKNVNGDKVVANSNKNCLEKNLNASKPSEHLPNQGK